MFSELCFGVISIFSFYIILTLFLRRRPKSFPPGPVSLPIFGNMLQLGMEPFKTAMALRKTYGDIIGIDLGCRRGVLIAEYKILKEAFSMGQFIGRPAMYHFEDPITKDLRGIAFTSGRLWTEQRKYAFSYIQAALRNRETMESLSRTEITELIEDLKKTSGTPLNTRHLFNISVVNTLWGILAGKRHSIKDKAFYKVIKHGSVIVSSPRLQGFLVFFPTFSKMFKKLSGWQLFRDDLEPVYEFMKNVVDEHKETLKEGVERDYVDSCLHKIKITTDETSSFYGESGEINLMHNLSQLFLAGNDPVPTTLGWLVFLMAHFPQIQERVITTISRLEELSLKDREHLVYIEAVIQEVLRFSALAPLGIFHETMEDVKLSGYDIPKGTMIVANQYGILHDPEVWGDPENFRPERFLTEDETEVIYHPAVIAFSTGRRTCPGEGFARDQLYFITISLFQNFRVEFDPSQPKPPLKYNMGNTLVPVDHKIVFSKLHYK